METKKSYYELMDYVKKYETSFKRANIDASKLYDLQELYNIEVKTEVYFKDGRKNFPKKPSKVEDYQVISLDYFMNFISGIGCFNDRIEKGYTQVGYLMKKSSCKNPYDNNTKIIRYFRYNHK